MASQLDLFGVAEAKPDPPAHRVQLPAWAAQRVLCGEPRESVEREVLAQLSEYRRKALTHYFVNVSDGPLHFDVPNAPYQSNAVRHGHIWLRPEQWASLDQRVREVLVPCTEARRMLRVGDLPATRMLVGSLVSSGVLSSDEASMLRVEDR